MNYRESLGFLDDGTKDVEIARLKKKQAELLSRWDRDELVTMRDFIFLTGLSRDMVDRYIRHKPLSLKYHQLGEGTKIYFKKSDWDEFKSYMEC